MEAKLTKLKAYNQRHGDCSVPKGWAEEPRLATWVSAQRQYKKKLDRGDPSKGMMVAWVAKLDALGFEWDLYAVVVSKQRSEGDRNDVG